jgi:16S rRNA (uracil1498-N3)-methyltransferase
MRINSLVTPGSLQNDSVVLSPDESHHLARVLRVEPGQELTLFDGQGTRAKGVIDSVTKKEVSVRVMNRETVPPPAVEITLIQAVCKPDRFEMILQKATELGVTDIQPIVTANASLPAGKIEKMIGRGEAIIRNASQQCGTAWLPHFHRLRRGTDIFPNIGNFDAVFIGSLHPNAKPFKEALRQLHEAGGTPAIRTAGVPPASVALLIGPEGDFTEEEVTAAVKAGAIPVTFGKQILRTETAAIFGLSVLAYELF